MSIATAIGLLVLVTAGYLALRGLAAYWRVHGPLVVTCPRTGAPAGVTVEGLRAAITGSVYGAHRQLKVRTCTYWPEKAGCSEDCVRQIEVAPAEHQVRSILKRWYAGKSCAICRRIIGAIDCPTHESGLMSPDGRVRNWADVPSNELPGVLETHVPVCMDCHLVYDLSRAHPDTFYRSRRDGPWDRAERPPPWSVD
jgi:hypothetical protein